MRCYEVLDMRVPEETRKHEEDVVDDGRNHEVAVENEG